MKWFFQSLLHNTLLPLVPSVSSCLANSCPQLVRVTRPCDSRMGQSPSHLPMALCAPLLTGPLIPAPVLQVARGIAGAIFTCPVLSHSGKYPLFRMALHAMHRHYSSSLCPFGSVPRPHPPLSAPASQVAGSSAPATPRLAKALACSVTPRDSCTNLGKELLRTDLSFLYCRHAVIVESWKQTLLLRR